MIKPNLEENKHASEQDTTSSTTNISRDAMALM